MSMTGRLFLNTQISKDLDRQRAAKQDVAIPMTTLNDMARLIVTASIPNHPYEVQPWPEEARPKVEMPV